MRRPRQLLTATMTSLAIASVSAPTFAAEHEDAGFFDAASIGETLGEVAVGTVDLFILRPLGVGRLLIGGAVLMPISVALNLAVLPFSRDRNVFAEDWDRFVVEPKEYTFDRPLGEDLVGG